VSGVVIANPSAGSAERLGTLAERLAEAGLVVREARAPGEAASLARAALAGGTGLVVAAGGDGTVREVASAVVDSGRDACFGILPFGTGNDLARALGIPLEPAAALEVVASGRDRRIDAVGLETGVSLATIPEDEDVPPHRPRHAFNVVAAGFSGEVAGRLTEEAKGRWGSLAYVIGLVQALPERVAHEITLTFDDSEVEHVEAMNVIVANGRSIAGGHVLAPDAELDDGMVEVLVFRPSSLLEISTLAARFALGTHLESGLVTVRRAHSLRIACEAGLLFNVDGEIDASFGMGLRVLPKALRVRVP
jgi:diacylglycerol kinase (ATP)